MNRIRGLVLLLACVGVTWVGGLETASAQVPVSFSHQGRILDNASNPVSDPVTMQVTLYNAADGGAILWQDQLDVDPDQTGFYTITLGGASNPIDSTILRDGEVYLAMAINDGEELSPRAKLHAVPYAQVAARAESVADGSVSPASLAIDFKLDSARIDSVGWDTVSDVPADLADGDDDTLGGMSCQGGQVASFDGTNWACADFPSYDGSDFATADQSCPSGEVATGIAVDGTLMCAPDQDTDNDTTYAAGAGLALNGTTFEVDTAALDDSYAANDQSCPDGAVMQGINPDGTINCDSGTGRFASHSVTINDTATDLGDQLNALLDQYRAVSVTLERNRIYTWNNRVNVGANQTLYVTGAGYTNGAGNIGVTIRMTQNSTHTHNGTDYRDPARVRVGRRGIFSLGGVEVQETANDSRPLAQPGASKALFNVTGDQAILSLTQIRMTTTEHVTNFSGHAYGRIKFGHTFIDLAGGSIRNVEAVSANSGWSFGGNGGVVSRSHTTLGTGVTYSSDAGITYLN